MSYEILPEQKANLKKFPKRILEVDEKKKGNKNNENKLQQGIQSTDQRLSSNPPMINLSSESTNTIQTITSQEPITNIDFGETTSFQSVKTITYYQGNQHYCFEYSILSAINNLVSYYKFHMKESSNILCQKLRNFRCRRLYVCCITL